MYDAPAVPMPTRLILPRTLTWAEVDPARHPFDPVAAPAVIRDLPPARQTLSRPTGPAADSGVIRWSHQASTEWADAMSLALVDHYGRWTCGWRWAGGEGDFDGGPIANWCCPRDSMSTPEASLTAVTRSLLEWRDWLEELAERFDRFLPIPPGASTDDVLDVWERAVAHLVTVVVDRSAHSSGWYTHCQQVLGWFLSAAGIPADRHGGMIDDAVGGRFHSWVEPKRLVVTDVAERLARAALRQRDA